MTDRSWTKTAKSFKKVLVDFSLSLYYIIEGIVLWLIPKRFRFKDIKGELVLITGGGSGIGRELALKFASYGVTLILVDIDVKGMEITKDLVVKRSEGKVDVSFYQCDVSDRQAVYAMAAKIKDEIGTVTILVNNAGIVTGKPFLDCPDDRIQKTMDVNIMAHFWTCKAFLPDMKASNHGHIVCIASVAGLTPGPKMVDYCASKYAAVGFEEALRLELEFDGYTGIKTTVAIPLFATTPLFDGCYLSLVPPMNPEKVAKGIVSAVLVNQEVIVMPGWFYILMVLKAVIPRKAVRQVYDMTGFIHCMDNFKGKKTE